MVRSIGSAVVALAAVALSFGTADSEHASLFGEKSRRHVAAMADFGSSGGNGSHGGLFSRGSNGSSGSYGSHGGLFSPSPIARLEWRLRIEWWQRVVRRLWFEWRRGRERRSGPGAESTATAETK